MGRVADGDPFPTSRHCAALTFHAPGPTQRIITATHDGFVLSTTSSISDISAESQNDHQARSPTGRDSDALFGYPSRIWNTHLPVLFFLCPFGLV